MFGEQYRNTLWRMHIPRVRVPQHDDWWITCRFLTGVLIGMGPLDYQMIPYRTVSDMQTLILFIDSSKHNNWNCTKVYNCSSWEAGIQRLCLVAQVFQICCICCNCTTPINDTWSHLTNNDTWSDMICSELTEPSMGLTACSSDGTRTTDLPVRGQWCQHMLETLTLCHLWREQYLAPAPWRQTKR